MKICFMYLLSKPSVFDTDLKEMQAGQIVSDEAMMQR